MKPKTMILMVVAVGCGLGASYMTSQLLAERGNAKQPEVATVPVLVAKARVPGWLPIKEPEKYFEIKEFPEDVAPRKALGSLSDVKDQRLNKPIDEGKPISQDDLLTKEQEDVSSKLLPGQRAVAIKVTAESSISGFVLPGSRVDVLCTTRGAEASTKVVLQNMLILAVDTNHQRNPEQTSILGQTVTVAATPNEAARLTLASSIGELRLALKGNGDTKRIGAVVAKASDLDKPLINESSDKGDADLAPAPAAQLPLPQLPADDKAPKVEEPKPVAVEKPRKRHVMTIINGTQKEKAIFHEEEDEDVASSAAVAAKANEEEAAKPDEKKDAKPEAKKDSPKPADKAAPAAPPVPNPFGKSTRTKRIQ